MPVAAAVGAIGGALISSSASKKAGKSVERSAQQAADAQKYAVDQTIAHQTQAATEGRAFVDPYRQPGLDAYKLMQGAAGMTGAEGATAAQSAYDQSWEAQAAADQLQRTQDAALSTNAAAGRGGSFNSGKALRNLYDMRTQIDLANRNALYGKWGAMADTGYNAAVASGNYGVGAAGQISNALSAQAANLSQIYQNRGSQQASLQLQQGANLAGALGSLTRIGSNMQFPNALGGGGANPTPVKTAPGFTGFTGVPKI